MFRLFGTRQLSQKFKKKLFVITPIILLKLCYVFPSVKAYLQTYKIEHNLYKCITITRKNVLLKITRLVSKKRTNLPVLFSFGKMRNRSGFEENVQMQKKYSRV
jgi:hypothetical protein